MGELGRHRGREAVVDHVRVVEHGRHPGEARLHEDGPQAREPVEDAAEGQLGPVLPEALHLGQDGHPDRARFRGGNGLADVEGQRQAGVLDRLPEGVHPRMVVLDGPAVLELAGLDRDHQAAGAQFHAPRHAVPRRLRVPVAGDHDGIEPTRGLGAHLADVLVVGAEDVLPVRDLAEHHQAEEALREDELLLHALDIQVLQAGLDACQAGIALKGVAEVPGDGIGGHGPAVDGEVPAAIPEDHPRGGVAQVGRKAVDPEVGLKHVAVGGDDARSRRPVAHLGLRRALRRHRLANLFGNLKDEALSHGDASRSFGRGYARGKNESSLSGARPQSLHFTRARKASA